MALSDFSLKSNIGGSGYDTSRFGRFGRFGRAELPSRNAGRWQPGAGIG
jgi:hypothetical protein